MSRYSARGMKSGLRMMPDHFHGIPIPENFEEINDTKMIPLLRSALTFVHEYQNAWHNSIGIKDDWKLK